MGLNLPFFASLSGYQASWVRYDVAAGLAVAAVGLPSAIAYPAIAGLPPETGIYASIAPLIAYAFFGPSRKLIVGPDAAIMTILAAALVSIMASAPAGIDRTAVAAILALGVGLFYLAAWVLRLGVLASFLSRPILIGFFTGISLSILVGQIKRVTGVDIESDGLIRPVIELLQKTSSIHWPSLVLALGMFGLLQIVRIVRFPVPGPVVVLVLSVVLSALFNFEGQGIAIVGDIPTNLPSLTLPQLAGLPLQTLALGSAAIFLVSFGSGIITARSFGALGGYQVDPNRELVGFGAANIAAGLIGAIPVGASDSRTAVNLSVGGRSQMVSVVAAATLLAALVFLAPALRIIPIPTLGAILMATALGLIDFTALRQIWRISRMEFVFAFIALLGPISLGVLNGVLLAIAATLVYILRKTMFPRDAMLGRIPGRDAFYKLHRTPEARQVPGLAICLIQGALLFFNTDYIESRLRSIADNLSADTRWLLLDASSIPQIDSSAAEMLTQLCIEFRERGIKFGLAELHAEAREMLDRAGVIECIGSDMVFDVLEDAYRFFEASNDRPKQ
ncbi:SulP family inorganic anion transporter [Sphingomonas sp. G124]|uniref:SulP family inorganic anion transporter n=1 Tax=Sphingomonas cremea TaxID=2904799 RepID=A0A9X1QJI4_9SPHN|nr:SulP family inorganic anion transporter [Sphingomonas cremea]MCF2513704.1 SulP family inorganic anion transporter [Sphingomonas cremea]